MTLLKGGSLAAAQTRGEFSRDLGNGIPEFR